MLTFNHDTPSNLAYHPEAADPELPWQMLVWLSLTGFSNCGAGGRRDGCVISKHNRGHAQEKRRVSLKVRKIRAGFAVEAVFKSLNISWSLDFLKQILLFFSLLHC